MSTPRTSVLVVGAGPTGLTLAALLQQYGIKVRLIERQAALSRHTKATNLMQRSQEVLHALKLLSPIEESGGQMSRLMVHAYGKCFGPSTMHLRESPFHNVILCGQNNFESAMAKGLRERGVAVEFGTTLTGLRQESEEVMTTLQTSHGNESVTADFVVGCDGATGLTRTFTKHNFTPQKTGVGLRQVDCHLSWRRLSGMEQMWLFYFDHGFGAVVPLPGGIHRIISVEPKARMPERNPTLEEMQTKLRTMANDPEATLTNASWSSYSDLSMGLAPGLRDRRIFLAGDVGNPILPNGGQGMNTGIGDAFNLGWKLAAVLKGEAPDRLLDTYQDERLKLRKTLQSAQYSSLKYTTLVTPKIVQTLFRWFAESALKWGGEYKMAQAFSQLNIHTRASPLSLEKRGRQGLRAGDRALDAEVISDTGVVHLYDLIYAGPWTLLAFTGTRTPNVELLDLALQKLRRQDVPAYLISTFAQSSRVAATLYDLDELAHRTYRVKTPTLYLVRPDGHVGARIGANHISHLQKYLHDWFAANPDATASTR